MRASERWTAATGLVEACVGLVIGTGAVILSLALFASGHRRSHDIDRLEDGLRQIHRARIAFRADVAAAVAVAHSDSTTDALELAVAIGFAPDGTLSAMKAAYRLETARGRTWLTRNGSRVAGPFRGGRFLAGRDGAGVPFVGLQLTADGTSRGIPTAHTICETAPHALALPGLEEAVDVPR